MLIFRLANTFCCSSFGVIFYYLKKWCLLHFQVFEVAPSLHMVELRKIGGDTLEFHKASIYFSVWFVFETYRSKQLIMSLGQTYLTYIKKTA